MVPRVGELRALDLLAGLGAVDRQRRIVASFASIGSFASAGSVLSSLSLLSLLSHQSNGSALSHQSNGSVLSSRSRSAVLGHQTQGEVPAGVVAVGVLVLLATAAVHRARRG